MGRAVLGWAPSCLPFLTHLLCKLSGGPALLQQDGGLAPVRGREALPKEPRCTRFARTATWRGCPCIGPAAWSRSNSQHHVGDPS